MGLEADSRSTFYSWGIVWGLMSIVIGAICWILGDGRSLGVNPPISDNAKLGITLLGWPFIIDGFRVMFGRRSFMRWVYPYTLYAVGLALAVVLVIWIYNLSVSKHWLPLV